MKGYFNEEIRVRMIHIFSGFSRGSNLDFFRSFCIVFINIFTSGIFYQIEKCESWIGIHRSRSIWSYFLLYGRSDTIWTGNAFKLLCALEREISYKQETERSKNSRHIPTAWLMHTYSIFSKNTTTKVLENGPESHSLQFQNL